MHYLNEKRKRSGIIDKIENGTYTLMKNESSKNEVWQIFAIICENVGETHVANGQVYCTKCHRTYLFCSVNKLRKHKCFADLNLEDDEESDAENEVITGVSMVRWPLDEKSQKFFRLEQRLANR